MTPNTSATTAPSDAPQMAWLSSNGADDSKRKPRDLKKQIERQDASRDGTQCKREKVQSTGTTQCAHDR